MNSVFQKLQVSLMQKAFVLNRALTLCRATPSIQHPACGTEFANDRQYHSMPTHGIGSWRKFFKAKKIKTKKGKSQRKPVIPVRFTAYGVLNVKVSGYDMTLVEHYTQYIHSLCNRLSIQVRQCYALPTKTTEVMLMQEKVSKLHSDAILKTHERVVEVRYLKTALCPIFMEVILKNQPEGVQLSVKRHTDADHKARFKLRPELEELIAQINQ